MDSSTPISSLGKIGLNQLNAHRAKAAHVNINLESDKLDRFIYFLQEPHYNVATGKVMDLNQTHHIVSAKDPRACIYAHKSLQLWESKDYTDKDIATCLWKLPDGSEIYLASVYLDITKQQVIPDILMELMTFCQQRDKPIILAIDSNAHSTLWGSEQTNIRGEDLEEFIFNHDLTLLNQGNKPTFQTSRAASIIDITLVSPILVSKIKKWKVCDGDSFSDHRKISMDFLTQSEPLKITRNIKKQIGQVLKMTY